jgi:A/G-specific adenine glycosylase
VLSPRQRLCHKRAVPVDSLNTNFAETLLAWYDVHARRLPWRALPGTPPTDAYRVWLSEIMLQQTTIAAVTPYYERFLARWPTVAALAAADDAEVMAAWAGLGYYARARNLLACARAVGDRFPQTEAELRALPGIGQYTAAAIASIAFGQRAVVVDGNVERVVSRLFEVETPLPKAKPELNRLTDSITPKTRAGDFAQAMMDLGSTICTPRRPDCLACPVRQMCRATVPETYPRKLPKAAKPARTGVAVWMTDRSNVYLVQRPAKGLLGGMRALPSGGWDGTAAPTPGTLIGNVTHGFTHFDLTLAVHKSSCALQPGGEWWPLAEIGSAGLPSVFMKAAQLALKEGFA